MKLSPRFALDNLFVVAAAFLAVSAMTFTASKAGWIGFGVSTGLTVLAFGSAVAARATGQKIGHSALGLVGLWSLVAALVDRKSTRLNSSHQIISYAVFCLKKKRPAPTATERLRHHLDLRP